MSMQMYQVDIFLHVQQNKSHIFWNEIIKVC